MQLMEQNFPTPYALQELAGAERAEAAMLIEAAEQAIATAEFDEPPRDGSRYRHEADEVELTGDNDRAESALLDLQRFSDGTNVGNRYLVTHENGSMVMVELSSRQDVQEDEDARVVQDAIGAIERGEVRGTYRRSVNKWLEASEEDTSPVILHVAVTRTNDGRSMPTTIIDMSLFRVYDASGVISQTRRIESDPNTGEVRMGDRVENDMFLNPADHEGTAYVRHTSRLLADPFAEMTIADLQREIYPPIPLDTPIDAETWQRLITQPLDPRDKLES